MTTRKCAGSGTIIAVGEDGRARCPYCGHRINVTVRGRLFGHNGRRSSAPRKRAALAAGALMTAAAICATPAIAHADANSYLDYLAAHHIATGLNTPAFNVKAGIQTCGMLRSGMTPDQVAHTDLIDIGVDVPGMIDAAQHELCPDTLR